MTRSRPIRASPRPPLPAPDPLDGPGFWGAGNDPGATRTEKMNTLRNLTPHPIVIGARVIAPTGEVARVATSEVAAGEWDGVPLVVTTYGEVTGLPAQEEGTLLIVSGLVRAALPARRDLASPSGLVRDAAGAVVGCAALAVNGEGAA